ncbi:hypothetical protein AB0C13_18170 [Streptomyces sp. NPDC049099]|uniref:hypothetical protein n=1 Tax=Streptomyces sp. NPDC049099 TaxID=3155768 RepID=UPI00341329F4
MPAGAAVIHECDRIRAERFHEVIVGGVVEPTVQLSVKSSSVGWRGEEVWSDAADSYVFDAVAAATMYRSKMCAGEWSDQALEEMTDRLMLPLLRPHGG